MALQNMGQSIPNLVQYAKHLDDTMPAQNIAQFPLSKTLPQPETFAARNETPPSHIPPFLPAFPDPHTLLETAKFAHTAHTAQTRQQQVAEQQQKGEEALLRVEAREHPESAPLQSAKQRLDAVAAGVGVGGGSGAEDNGILEENIFLAGPVLRWEGDRQVANGTEVGDGGRRRAHAQEEGGATVAATATATDEEEFKFEWVPTASTAGPEENVHFEAFQVSATGTKVMLATSGRYVFLMFLFFPSFLFHVRYMYETDVNNYYRLHVPDAYGGEEGGEVAVTGGGARRRRSAAVSETKVKDILSTRAEDAEAAFHAADEAMLDEELI